MTYHECVLCGKFCFELLVTCVKFCKMAGLDLSMSVSAWLSGFPVHWVWRPGLFVDLDELLGAGAALIPTCAPVLDATPTQRLAFLTKAQGTPFTAAGFGN